MQENKNKAQIVTKKKVQKLQNQQQQTAKQKQNPTD